MSVSTETCILSPRSSIIDGDGDWISEDTSILLLKFLPASKWGEPKLGREGYFWKWYSFKNVFFLLLILLFIILWIEMTSFNPQFVILIVVKVDYSPRKKIQWVTYRSSHNTSIPFCQGDCSSLANKNNSYWLFSIILCTISGVFWKIIYVNGNTTSDAQTSFW